MSSDTLRRMACAKGCCETAGEHYRSLSLGTPTPDATSTNQFEAALDKDRPAYKRLREEGLQPARLKGAAELEKRAGSRFEIETGRILPHHLSKRMDSAVVEAAQVTST